MDYYEVHIASQRYQKKEPLTYSFEGVLSEGDVVIAPLGKAQSLGFVSKKVAKPKFVCKPVTRTLKGIKLPPNSIKLYRWLQEYYPAGSGPSLQLFLPSALITKIEKTLEITDDESQSNLSETSLPKLTQDQNKAVELMDKADSKRFLLHGETGSGKTRVYIERAKKCLDEGKSAIILTPEIGLTTQLANSFKQNFGNKVIIIHSNLTAKTRREYWLKIATYNEPLVIVGPRSALFSPVRNLGLIVVDEFHEPAYKQEQTPRYQTVRVAGALASICKAEIIYGSATPPVADYYLAEQTGMQIIVMKNSAKKSDHKVAIEISDLTDKSGYSRHPYISDILLKAIEESLKKGEQTLVYLNRRGTAKLVLCQSCGWQALCPRCDLPLTYHGDGHNLRCHTCGHQGQAPLSCPACSSTGLQYRTMGTKALLETLQGFFPSARLQRFDTDLGVADRMDKHYKNIHDGNVDILVGTQMLGKGLDLPKLGLVGVISADTSLYMPDFTASERSYQLLHQVLGRVGRGHRAGRVIIQTYIPKNPLLISAINKDYDSFYNAEIIERKNYLFPPFCYLLKITTSRKSSKSAETAIKTIHRSLETTKLKLRLSDPTPSFYEHTHDMYHWQLILKSKDRKELIKALESLPSSNYTYDLDPSNLL